MEKEYIPYEQALDLKELGFDESCFGFYNIKGVLVPDYRISKKDVDNLNLDKCCLGPLYQQAFRWFREKHNLHSWVRQWTDTKEFCYEIFRDKDDKDNDFDTYEDAEYNCLNKLIEILKVKK